MSVIERLAFWRKPSLRAHELAVLDAVSTRLPHNLREMYDAQVSLLGASRETLDKEVLLRGLPESVPLFSNRGSEMRFATVRIAGKQPVTADVWVGSGKLLALTFSEPPRKWARDSFSIAEVVLWEDLASPSLPLEPVDSAKVLAWASGLPIVDVLGPQPAGARARRIEALASKVPPDWADMLALTDGFRVGDTRVYGIGEARTVVLDDEEVVVVAESERPTLLVLCRTRSDGHVYVYDLERHELSDAGFSFREALRGYVAL